jgi:hypothetical protein
MSDAPKPIDTRARREAELAEALRANLRRRKAPPEKAPKEAVEQADAPLPRPTDAR